MSLPPEVEAFVDGRCKPAGLVVDRVVAEPEGVAYRACRLEVGGRTGLFRVAKQTPKKVGHFVTVWKRPNQDTEIAPFDVKDGIAFVVVVVEHDDRFGQFIFDSKTLEAKGVFASGSNGGKRAFRVYAPTTAPTSATAKRTQRWQVPFFADEGADLARMFLPAFGSSADQ